ncbi:MAG: ribokinase [Candidatus Limivicinus sp.]
MKKTKILVVGSFVMDQIVTTDVFPRQGQTILAKTFSKAPGGKGANQAVQMARLGAEVTMCGKLGHDANGREMLDVCKQSGINTEHICYDDKAASGCSVIILEEKQGESTENRIMVIPGSNMSFQSQDVEFLKDSIGEYDLVVLQLEIPMEINVQVAQYAHAKGVPVMLNPAPSAPLPDELLSCLDYISPNEHEARDLTGIEIAHKGAEIDIQAVKAAAAALAAKGVQNVLITLGSAGAALVKGDDFWISPAVKGVKAVDPTAAGDSFVGAFCVAVCSGMKPEEALSFANNTAAITVSKMGAMPSLPTLDEVKKTMEEI